MEKILVCSDSHRELDYMERAVELLKPDRVIHLGDCAEDAEALQQRFFYLPVANVAGNCDPRSESPSSLYFQIDGVSVFACHGHRYQVKSGMMSLYYAALEKKARVCLFGHTHSAYAAEESGILFLNPGACGGVRPTCALLTVGNGTVSYSFTNL